MGQAKRNRDRERRLFGDCIKCGKRARHKGKYGVGGFCLICIRIRETRKALNPPGSGFHLRVAQHLQVLGGRKKLNDMIEVYWNLDAAEKALGASRDVEGANGGIPSANHVVLPEGEEHGEYLI